MPGDERMGMDMNYLIPFSRLKDHIKIASVKGPLKVDLRYDELLELIKLLLGAVTVDEAWYCEMYPDVADAIASGVYASAKQHFVENGYVEGRHPCAMAVNETWYLQQYPDVKERIRSGDIPSAQEHFTKHGYDEGRHPGPVTVSNSRACDEFDGPADCREDSYYWIGHTCHTQD